MDTSRQVAVIPKGEKPSVVAPAAAAQHCREAADCRRDVGRGRVGGADRASARDERESGVWLAPAVPGGRLGERKPTMKLLPVRVSESLLPADHASSRRFTLARCCEAKAVRARSTSNCAKRRCGSKAEPIQLWCAWCWSACAMIGCRPSTRIWIAAGVTDLRRGFTGLSALVQTKLEQSPFSGHVFVFRGRRGDLIKVLWYDGDGLCLFAKRLERGRFVWPQATSGTVSLTRAQLSMLLEGIDWRRRSAPGSRSCRCNPQDSFAQLFSCTRG